jgi:nucleotide-binding universal stress UspA family protein
MYRRILVPLDGSEEAEKVLPLVQKGLSPGGEVVLLHVLPVLQAVKVGQQVLPGAQREESERFKALGYLQGIAKRLGESFGELRCEVIVSKSVPEAIADFAARQEVDLISMYTHDRRGMARLIRGSIAEKVRQRAPTEVQVFRPQELPETAPAEAPAEDD